MPSAPSSSCRAGAREHVERGLGHVGVRVAGALVAAGELALHRRHVDDVGAARRRRGQRGAQPADQDERRGLVAELDLEQLDRVDLVDDLAPAVVRRAGRAPGRRRRSPCRWRSRSGDAEPAVSASAVSACGVGAQCGRRAAPAVPWPCARAPERHDLGQRARPAAAPARRRQVRVGLGRAAHGLRGVVDQDVERALRGDLVGERDDLRRVAQVDADDAQAVQPVARCRPSRRSAGRRRAGSAS